MSVTIRDISRKLHISPGSISKILNGKYKTSNIKFKPATIRKVEQYAKKTQYRPKYAAKVLSTGKSSIIGVYMPIFKNPKYRVGHYHTLLLEAIERTALKFGYDILLTNYLSVVDEFQIGRIDGLIIVELMDEELNTIKELTKKKCPFLVINNQLSDPGFVVPTVNLNNSIGVEKIIRNFKDNGHRDLAFISPLFEPENKEFVERLNLFRKFLESSGLAVHEELFLHGLRRDLPAQTNFEISGYEGMKYLVENHSNSFTGVFCVDDYVAIGALRYLQESSVDKSVIGFDDMPLADLVYGGITTISQPIETMGQVGVENLIKIMAKELKPDQYYCEISPELVSRKSVRIQTNTAI